MFSVPLSIFLSPCTPRFILHVINLFRAFILSFALYLLYYHHFDFFSKICFCCYFLINLLGLYNYFNYSLSWLLLLLLFFKFSSSSKYIFRGDSLDLSKDRHEFVDQQWSNLDQTNLYHCAQIVIPFSATFIISLNEINVTIYCFIPGLTALLGVCIICKSKPFLHPSCLIQPCLSRFTSLVSAIFAIRYHTVGPSDYFTVRSAGFTRTAE